MEASVSDKKTTSNIDIEIDGSEAGDDDLTKDPRGKGITPAKKKPKLNPGDMHLANILEKSLLARQAEAEQHNDEDRLFCLSLIKELKKVPENNRLMTKIELLIVVHRAQAFGAYHPIQPLHHPRLYSQSHPHYSGYTPQPQPPHFSAHQTTPSPAAMNSGTVAQPVHQTHLNMQPFACTSGYSSHTPTPPSVVNSPSPSTENTSKVQHVHQAHLNMQPFACTSGYNTHAPTPSPGNTSQASDTQSDYIDMF